MKNILEWIWTADDFADDPIGYLWTGAGHVAVGFGLVWLGVPPLWAVMLYMAGIEAVQLYRGGGLYDSIEDGVHVTLGVITYYWWPVVVLAALILGIGVVSRR